MNTAFKGNPFGLLIIFSMAVGSFLNSGCASGSKATVEKDTQAKTFIPNETKGTVYMYRPGKAFAGGMLAPIKVNGADAGGMGPGSYFKWELDKGTYTFSTMMEGSSAVAELNVEAGQLYFLKMDYNINLVFGARAKMDKIEGTEGMKEVEKSKLLISTYK
jgi:Protein of unknown function (DUF2846)